MSIISPLPGDSDDDILQAAIRSGINDLDSFRRWALSPNFPQRGQISFLDGVLEIDMTREEINSHNFLRLAIVTALHNHVATSDLGKVFPRGVLLVNVDANIAVMPDAMFFRWETFQSGRAHLVESEPGSRRFMELQGSPDVVVEIVSRSSVRKDTKILRKKYFEAGVSEYWLIDAQGPEIDFELLVRGANRFRAARPGKDGSRLSTVFQRRVALSRELDRIGLWKYRIEWLEMPA